VLAFISAHVDDGHLREPLSSSAASALAVLKVTLALFLFLLCAVVAIMIAAFGPTIGVIFFHFLLL
jgi:hypothetical protein